MNEFWLIDEIHAEPLVKAHTIVDNQLMHKGDVTVTEPRDVVIRHEDFNEFRISGPIVARESWVTNYLGISSTQQYMKAWDDMIQDGRPVLLKVDTNGGDAVFAFEFADMIFDAGERVSAYTDSAAASAGGLFFLAAQGKRYVHDTAMIGSFGVISYVYKDNDDMKVIASKNAKNKVPNEKNIQKRIDNLETIFTDRLSKFTGMDADDIVKAGDFGSVFDGQQAVDMGFADGLSSYKNILENFGMTETTSSGNSTDATKQAVETAIKQRDDRWIAMLNHDSIKADMSSVIHFATMSVPDNEALASMNHVSMKDAEIKPEEKNTTDVSEQVSNGIKEGNKQLLDGFQKLIQNMRHEDNVDLKNGDDNNGNGETVEDETPSMSDEERGAAAANRGN